MTKKEMRESRFVAIVTVVTILVVFVAVSLNFSNTVQTKRNWIDQCVIQEWESTGERHVGVTDYCIAKYRQMR